MNVLKVKLLSVHSGSHDSCRTTSHSQQGFMQSDDFSNLMKLFFLAFRAIVLFPNILLAHPWEMHYSLLTRQ